MLAGSRPKKMLTSYQPKNVLVGSRTKKVLTDALKFSAKEDHRRCSRVSLSKKVFADACKFPSKEFALKFSKKEDPRECSRVLSQRRCSQKFSRPCRSIISRPT
ncbi:hypothetical protein ACOSQ4_027365 [Xanthoceras sorbifolium]